MNSAPNRRLLAALEALFVASLVLTLGCAVAWWVSDAHPVGIVRTSVHGRIDIRIRAGGICITNGSETLGANAGWALADEPVKGSRIDPWPEIGLPNYWFPKRGIVRVYPSDPNDASWLCFVSIYQPNITVVAIPFWPVIMVLIAFQVWWFRRRQSALIRAARGHCIGCGYDLQGIESLRCPECGKQFTWGKVQAIPAARHKTA